MGGGSALVPCHWCEGWEALAVQKQEKNESNELADMELSEENAPHNVAAPSVQGDEHPADELFDLFAGLDSLDGLQSLLAVFTQQQQSAKEKNLYEGKDEDLELKRQQAAKKF